VTRKSEENRDEEEKTQNIRAKNKEQAKRATTGNQSLSKTQKRGHSLRDQSITRHVSVYSLRRLLSLSLRSRVWSPPLEVNQPRREAGDEERIRPLAEKKI